MCTYLIHFDTKFGHAQHYVGFTDNYSRRISEHRLSRGAKLLTAVNLAGIGWSVVKVWKDGRGRERHIKRQKNTKRFCPVCNP